MLRQHHNSMHLSREFQGQCFPKGKEKNTLFSDHTEIHSRRQPRAQWVESMRLNCSHHRQRKQQLPQAPLSVLPGRNTIWVSAPARVQHKPACIPTTTEKYIAEIASVPATTQQSPLCNGTSHRLHVIPLRLNTTLPSLHVLPLLLRSLLPRLHA